MCLTAPRKSRAVLEDASFRGTSLPGPSRHPHLPIRCLEGQEDLLPLLVGATPQAVDDGLLVSSWRKKRWEWAGLGVVGCLQLETPQAWLLPFFWAPQCTPTSIFSPPRRAPG